MWLGTNGRWPGVRGREGGGDFDGMASQRQLARGESYQMAKKRRGGKRTVVMSVEKGGRRWE